MFRFDDDGYMESTPGMKRAVNLAVDLLKKEGHYVVKFKPKGIENMMNLYYDHTMSDGGTNSLENLKGDEIDKVSMNY